MRTSLRLVLACVLSSQVGVGVPFAGAQLVELDSFDGGTGELASMAFDAVQDRVWAHGSFDTNLLAFDRAGTPLPAIARPGESSNDIDIEVAPEPLTLGTTMLPAGTVLIVNGETGTADVYAVDPSDGSVLETLVTAFGNDHVVGGAWHPQRDTLFLVADQHDSTPSTIAEIDPTTGDVLNSFTATITINFGDLDVDVTTGNLLLVSSVVAAMRELTPTGVLVQDHPWPLGVGAISGLGIDEGRNELWVSSTSGTIHRLGLGMPTTTSTTTTSVSTTSTTTTTVVTSTTTFPTTSTAPPVSTSTTSTAPPTSTSTSSTTSTTSTTLAEAAIFLPGKKLLVKRKKSGLHRLQVLAKDAAIAPATPCEVDGELVVESVGAGSAPRRFPLDASLWKAINKKRPEKGCKYRNGPVVATVQIKTGKALKVVANADDLGVPLPTDPRPVRIEVRHGTARHCLEFGGAKGQHKADKKLLAKTAPPATVCPAGEGASTQARAR
jgi:hypothetical protein